MDLPEKRVPLKSHVGASHLVNGLKHVITPVRLREYQQLYSMKYGLYMAYIGDGLYRLREYPTYIWDYIGDGL